MLQDTIAYFWFKSHQVSIYVRWQLIGLWEHFHYANHSYVSFVLESSATNKMRNLPYCIKFETCVYLTQLENICQESVFISPRQRASVRGLCLPYSVRGDVRSLERTSPLLSYAWHVVGVHKFFTSTTKSRWHWKPTAPMKYQDGIYKHQNTFWVSYIRNLMLANHVWNRQLNWN
jgi:hypothetical protein